MKPACRPWWKKRRWRLALAFWLAVPVFYLLSAGPAAYCLGRGWITPETFASAYRYGEPVFGWMIEPSGLGVWNRSLHALGVRHAASE